MTERRTDQTSSLSSPMLQSPCRRVERAGASLSERINIMAQAVHLVDLNVDLLSFAVDDVGCLPLQWLSMNRYKRIHTIPEDQSGKTTYNIDVKRLAADVGQSAGHVKLMLALASADDEKTDDAKSLQKRLSELKVLTKCARQLPRIHNSKVVERHAISQYLCNHLLPAPLAADAADAADAAAGSPDPTLFLSTVPAYVWAFRSSRQWWAVTPTRYFKTPKGDGNDAYIFLGSFLTELGEAREAVFKCVPMANTSRVNDLVNEYCAIDRLHRFHSPNYDTRCMGRSHLTGEEELDTNAYIELARPQPCTTNLSKVPLHFTCALRSAQSHAEPQEYAVLVHPYYNGGTLADDNVVGKKERREVCRQMCRALWQIHRANMIHGDVKTANFFMHRRDGAQRELLRCSSDSNDASPDPNNKYAETSPIEPSTSTLSPVCSYDNADADFEVMLGDTESVETEGRILQEYLAAKQSNENFRVKIRYTTAYRIIPGDDPVYTGKGLFRVLQRADLEGLALSVLEVALQLSPVQWQNHDTSYADPRLIKQIMHSSAARLRRAGLSERLLSVIRRVLQVEADPSVTVESPDRITAETFLLAFEE